MARLRAQHRRRLLGVLLARCRIDGSELIVVKNLRSRRQPELPRKGELQRIESFLFGPIAHREGCSHYASGVPLPNRCQSALANVHELRSQQKTKLGPSERFVAQVGRRPDWTKRNREHWAVNK